MAQIINVHTIGDNKCKYTNLPSKQNHVGNWVSYSLVVAEGTRNRGIGLSVQHHVLVDRCPMLKRFGAQFALKRGQVCVSK